MRATRYLTCLAAAILLAAPVASAEPVKVGIIAPFSGPFSSFGETWKQGIAAYQKIHGNTAVVHSHLDLPLLLGALPKPRKAVWADLFVLCPSSAITASSGDTLDPSVL